MRCKKCGFRIRGKKHDEDIHHKVKRHIPKIGRRTKKPKVEETD